MKQYAWINVESMKKEINIRANNLIIIYANNYTLSIKVFNNDEIIVEKGCFAIIEKHSRFILQINKFNGGTPYEYVELDKNDIDNVLKIMDPMYNLYKPRTESGLKIEKRVSLIRCDAIATSLFCKVKENKNERLRAYEIACLLSMSDEPDKVYISLSRSATVYFCDVVRKLIENNIEKKWQLSLISHEMNLSEVTIRKRLESENTSFYQILLDVRMQKAAKLILKNDFQIGRVAKMVGMSSASYFIKVFSSYYGVTPKGYFRNHKEFAFDEPKINN